MRRKLTYSKPVLTDSIDNIGSLPQGDWHVSKQDGILFVGDDNWTGYAFLNTTTDEELFHLNKTTSMLVQAQNGTTCRDIAIESKPAYDIFVGGGGFRASSPRRPHRTSPVKAGGRRQLLRQGYGNLLALSLGVAA